MQEWIGQNLMYPREASNSGEQGIVYLKFIVGADGKLRDIFIA